MLIQQTLDEMDAIGLTAQMAGFNPDRSWPVLGDR